MSQKNSMKTGFLALVLLGLLFVGGVTLALRGPHAALVVAPTPAPVDYQSLLGSSSSIVENLPPVPKTSVSPAAPAAVEKVGIAVAQTLSSKSDVQIAAEFDDFNALGVAWVRFDIDWREIQPYNSSNFDWSNIDRIVHEANMHHLALLPILDDTPRWARREQCKAQAWCPPQDDSQFAAFAAAAVKRYAPQGIEQWEIWNEPNIASNWLPAADPQAYTALLIAADEAIKSIDPQATVITGGLGPIATGNGNIAPLIFLQALYADGAQQYFDAVGFHPYSFPAPPGFFATWNAWQQMTNTSPSLRSIMAEHGDQNKKIWMTEYGAPTGGPEGISETLQATMLSDAIELAQGYSWAGPLFFYTYKDSGTDESTSEDFFGLLHVDGSQKPGYIALKDALIRQ